MARRLKIIFCIAALAVLFALGLNGVGVSLHRGQFGGLFAGSQATEENLTEAITGKQYLLVPYRAVNALLGMRYFPGDELYIDDDGQELKSSFAKALPDLERIDNLARLCEERGVDLLYVLAPGKPQYDSELADIGIPCARNARADKFVEELRKRGIDCLDLRESFRDSFYDRFYKTDHHWTADAGLEATRLIAERLNDDFGLGLDTSKLDDALFKRTVYEDCYVGESGHATLGPFGVVEDFTVVEPAYDVRLRYQSPDIGIDKTGGFDIVFSERFLEDLSPMYASNRYYYYLEGNHNRVELTNYGQGEGDVLLVKDSFGQVVLPFLALACNHVTGWDMRVDTHVFEYIEEHPEIEAVVVLYNMGSLADKDLNDFE